MLHLTEALLLAAGGAALGVALAVWLKQLVATLLLPTVAAGPVLTVPLDMRVLAMTIGVSIGCGLGAGLVPALMGARRIRRHVRRCRRAIGHGHASDAAGFAVAQLALSLALVTGALMLVATLRNLNAIELGFEPDGVTTHGMDPSRHGYPPDRAAVYYRTMMERLHGAAGFGSFSIGALAPFGSGRRMRLQDPTGDRLRPHRGYANAVSRAYFDVLGMRIVRGRTFTTKRRCRRPVRRPSPWSARSWRDACSATSTRLAGSSSFTDFLARGVSAHRSWRGSRCSLEQCDGRTRAVPLSSVQQSGIRSAIRHAAGQVAAATRRGHPACGGGGKGRRPDAADSVLEGPANEHRSLAERPPRLRVGALDPRVARVRPRRGRSVWPLSQSVAERTREFGIRMAIGSGRTQIFVLVLRQAMWIGALGTVLGTGLAFAGSRLVEAQLDGVTRLDPAVYVASAVSLAIVVLLAGLWPARTATRIEPVEALRVE